MKNIFFFLVFAFCSATNAQIIHFPDPNFKNALVNTKCVDTNDDGIGDADADLNDDGEIDVSEALMVVRLNFIDKNISKLDGIEFFKNLKTLFCYYNPLVRLNVSELTNLNVLVCPFNQLTDLNVSGLLNLVRLECFNNQLQYLNLQDLTKLRSLDCSSNNITSINLLGLPNLEDLTCAFNKISILNLDHLTNLASLNCYENQLVFLNIKSTQVNQFLSLDGNPKLDVVCCNDEIIDGIKNKVLSLGLTNCKVNSKCD